MLQASVVISTYNRVQKLRRCLIAIENQTLSKSEFEVIVVDDGSRDNTRQFISEFRKTSGIRLKYFFQENRGPAAARNLGIHKAEANYIAFTDDDCLPASTWIKELISALPDNLKCAGVGGKIVRKRNSLISRYIDDTGAMEHEVKGDQVQYLVTANALYRASTLYEVGGFDNRITWPGGEDPDLSFRLRNLGYHLIRTNDSVVVHEHRDSLKGFFKMFCNYGQGKCALVQLGRLEESNIWYSLVDQYAVSLLKYWNRTDLKIHERLLYCFLRLVQHTGIHLGYMRCPNIR